MKPNTTKKTIVALGLVFFVLVVLSSPAFSALTNNEAAVTIMTQNMDAGTDLGFVLALGGTPESVDLTLAEIQASNIPGRAELLAAQIATEQPAILALEEVTMWRTGPTPETATITLYDQLELLLSALADEGIPYDIVAVNTLTDLALPGSTDYALRYTDRDVLLVRSDLRPPAFHLSDVHSLLYDAALAFGEFPIYQGWISADVHVGNRHFRLVETHLESPIPGVEVATEVQVAQAGQLVHTLRNLKIPVVVCGDFNSDANFGSGPDATPSVSLIEAAGYADTWRIANPSDSGNTWPLFLEDQYPPPFFVPYTPFERIDLFFSRGIDIIGVRQVLAPASAGSMPPYGSDHAGVIATFQP
jgi:endonuclease/exonuclease/phosphatase family metal-dependent hydrolase